MENDELVAPVQEPRQDDSQPAQQKRSPVQILATCFLAAVAVVVGFIIFVRASDPAVKLTMTSKLTESWPSWSPDGKYIAYFGAPVLDPPETEVHPWPNNVYVMGHDGKNVRNVSKVLRQEGYGNRFRTLRWSPDSTMLAFYQGQGDKPARLCVYHFATGTLSRIREGELGGGTWSGTDLHYVAVQDQKLKFYVWDSKSKVSSEESKKDIETASVPKPASKVVPGVRSSEVSPCGRYAVSVEESRDGNTDIYITPQRTGEKVKIAADGRCPDWSPDGRYVVFSKDGDLWLYDVSKIDNGGS